MTQDRLRARFRTSQLEDAGAEGRNPTGNPTMGEIIAARFSRRALLKGSMAATAIAATVGPAALLAAGRARAAEPASRLRLHRARRRRRRRPPRRRRLRRPGAAALGRPALRRFAGLRPDRPDRRGPGPPVRLQQRLRRLHPDRRLLRARPAGGQPRVHRPAADVPRRRQHRRQAAKAKVSDPDQARVDIEMAAHGGSIVEIRKVNGAGRWSATARRTAASPPPPRWR